MTRPAGTRVVPLFAAAILTTGTAAVTAGWFADTSAGPIVALTAAAVLVTAGVGYAATRAIRAITGPAAWTIAAFAVITVTLTVIYVT